MSNIQIGNRSAAPGEIKSFAFNLPESPPGDQDTRHLALIRVDLASGEMLLVRGADAITLKVLLASMGYPDLSASWHPVQKV